MRWADTQAVAETLGLTRFDEDDLYAALDWLANEQSRIERALVPGKPNGAVFLYDVASSYLEGQKNEVEGWVWGNMGRRAG